MHGKDILIRQTNRKLKMSSTKAISAVFSFKTMTQPIYIPRDFNVLTLF